jgi:H+/Cl- antiporter ClcA
MSRNDWANELRLIAFCALVGAFAGAVFWLFLFMVEQGTRLVWHTAPQGVVGSVWYAILVCSVCGLLVGMLRKRYGDYPESMEDVFARLKRTGTYPFRMLPVILAGALLPLICGSSVGPEAGMVGIIVALCCWAGENLRFAGREAAYYSKVGASVSLSVMFHSPLFGVFEVEEGEDADELAPLRRSSKVVTYCVAAGAGFGCFSVLSQLFGSVMSGFPSFEVASGDWRDIALFAPYVLAGVAFGLLFEASEHGFSWLAHRLPPVAREVAAGVALGIVTTFFPAVRFSGESQMDVLIEGGFATYAPLAILGVAFLKVLLTNMCIGCGLKGGHFFPLIFAAVCLGMGLSLLVFPEDLGHATIAAGVVAASTLAVTMRKPLAVAMLLMLCFPARMLLWTVPAAALATWLRGLAPKAPTSPHEETT